MAFKSGGGPPPPPPPSPPLAFPSVSSAKVKVWWMGGEKCEFASDEVRPVKWNSDSLEEEEEEKDEDGLGGG